MSTPTPSSSPWAATPSTPLGSSHISRTLFQNGSEDFQESPVGSPYRPQGTPGGQRNGASYAYGAEEDYGEADAGSIAAGSLAVNAASSLFTTDMFDSYPTEATTTPFSTTNSAVSTPNPNRTPNYAAYTPATPSGGSLIASNSLPGLSNYASTSPSALSPFVPAIYPTRNQPLAPYIVRPSPLPKTVTVHTDRSLAYLDSGNALRPSLRSKMDEIMSENRVRITVRRPATSVPPGGISGSGPGLGTIPPTDHDVERQAQVEIEIAGGSDRVEIARLNVLAALDELSGLHVEIVNLEPGQPNMFHNIIAGPKRQMLKNIMRRSKTSVYLPSPFVVQNIDVISEPAGMVVSGSAEGVAEASRMLRELAEAKKSQVKSPALYFSTHKLDWMLANRREPLTRCMWDNGTFVLFPVQAGSNSPQATPPGTRQVTVLGDDMVFVERTMRILTLLACECYVACIELSHPLNALPAINDAANYNGWPSSPHHQTPQPHSIQDFDWKPAIEGIAQSTRAVIIVRDQGRAIDILGVEATCKSAYNMVTEMVQVRPFINKASFRISLPAEHKEFIRGKKDGKITRVIKNSGGCGVRVDDDRGSRTVTVVVEHHDASRVLEGVALIEEELPAELAFHLPERYHKQAIGVGGRRIQAIMRRREAYVKFASSEEVARMGGFDVGEVGDNVIVRTPARNARNLELVRHDIEAAVGWAESSGGQNDGFVTVTMRIPRRYHRRMVSRGSVFGKTFGVEDQVDAVSEIEDRTGVRIRFPDRETGTDEVVIEGSQRGVEAAARVLQILIPSVVTMSLPAAAAPVVQSQAFRSNCVVSTALDYDSEVRVFVPSAEETRNAGSPGRSLPSTSSNASLLLKPDGKEEPIEVMIEADEPQRADEIAWLTIAPFLESHGIPLPQRRQPINAATSGLGHFDHRLLVDTVQREREMRERDIMIRAVNEQQHGRMHHDDYGGEDEWRGSGYGRPRDADYYGRRGNEPSPRPRQRQDWDSDAGMQRPSAGANFESWQQARMGYGSPSVSSSPTRSYSQAPRPNTVPRTGPGGPGASGGYANGNALRVNVSGQAPSYGSPRFAPSVPPRGAVPYYPQGPVMSGPHPPIMYFPVGYEPAADTLAVEAQMAAAAAEQQAREIGMTGARDDGQRTPNPEADMARDTSTPSGEAENFDKEGSAGDARILAVLEKAGLAKYHSIFTKEEFDYKSFIDVTDSELRELGVTAVGARKRILAAVQEESSSVGLRTQADPWPSPESHATVSADSSGSGDAARLTEQLAGLKTSSDADNVSPEPVASSSA